MRTVIINIKEFTGSIFISMCLSPNNINYITLLIKLINEHVNYRNLKFYIKIFIESRRDPDIF